MSDLQPEVDLAAALECFPGIVAVVSQFGSRKAPRPRNRALPDTAEWRSLLLSRVAGRPRVLLKALLGGVGTFGRFRCRASRTFPRVPDPGDASTLPAVIVLSRKGR